MGRRVARGLVRPQSAVDAFYSGPSAWHEISANHSVTVAQTTSDRLSVSVRSTPAATSVTMRTSGRRGSDDPFSVHARMISSPVRSLSLA